LPAALGAYFGVQIPIGLLRGLQDNFAEANDDFRGGVTALCAAADAKR
jgi:hypothetical protein